MSYKVTAIRAGKYWELHIDGEGVTQSLSLNGADRMVRDYLRLDGHADWATADVVIEPDRR